MGDIQLCELKLNQEIYPDDTAVRSISHIIHSNLESPNPINTSHHHNTSSSPSPTSTSTHTTPTPISTTSILYPTSISTLSFTYTSPLYSYPVLRRKVQDARQMGTLVSSGQQILDYFLNWLLFLNRDIRRGQNL